MRTLWGKAGFRFEMREVPTPEPGPGEVVVKIAACGICGTDRHFLRHNQEWTPLGHEVVGTIAAVGPHVERWQGGETVIVENHTGCGVCEQCKNGRALYCQNLTTYMEDRAGFADYLRVRADMVQAYDAGTLSPQQAALAEPLTVALDLLQRTDPDLNDEVAVFGPGAIGLMVTRLAKLRGARRVFLAGSNRSTPRGRHRLEVGRQMGADVVLAEAEDDIVAEIKAAVPQGVDRVLVTAPPRTLPAAFEIARFGAIVGFIGIEFGEGANVTFDANAFHFQKLQLRASHAIPNHYFPMALDLLARRVVDPDLLLSHVFSLDEYEEAFRVLTDPQQTAIKVVLVP
ncbi:MAG: alcohol dehydrogenase catalytic domain-containing protein [Anaerolineae bacterium]|nr:alcohol dehydrogenase catalytic domain-containing protein [Anaerolineae bacterium]